MKAQFKHRTPKSISRKERSIGMRLKEAGGVGSSTSIPHGAMPTLELYQHESCPFSHAVRTRLTELGLDFVAHTVPTGPGSDLKHKRLVDAGGKDQIPFLVDHRTGTQLYESVDIISYLNAEYGDGFEPGVVGTFRKAQVRLQAQSDEISWVVRQNVERVRRLSTQAGETLRLARDSAKTVARSVKQAFVETTPQS